MLALKAGESETKQSNAGEKNEKQMAILGGNGGAGRCDCMQSG